MSANENSPSVGLDLYNEANIYLFALKPQKKSSEQKDRKPILQASYNSEEPQLAGSLSSTSGGGAGVSFQSIFDTYLFNNVNLSNLSKKASLGAPEFNTLDEPIKETILRDLGAVASKFYHVLYPK